MDRPVPHATGKTAVEMNRNVQVLALKQRGSKYSRIEFLKGFGISRLCLGKNGYGFVFPDRQHSKADLFRQVNLPA